jgi:hypothetical protein
MISLTHHHKAKRSTNREFNLVRFCPMRLGHVLYTYLVFIRPFIEMLQCKQYSHSDIAASTSHRRLLFQLGHNLDKPWDSFRVRVILKKATAEVWGRTVDAQLH